jgi:hypothetical protein
VHGIFVECFDAQRAAEGDHPSAGFDVTHAATLIDGLAANNTQVIPFSYIGCLQFVHKSGKGTAACSDINGDCPFRCEPIRVTSSIPRLCLVLIIFLCFLFIFDQLIGFLLAGSCRTLCVSCFTALKSNAGLDVWS